METEYRTVARAAESEIVIKKSRFIGQVAPVQSPEEAAAFVTQVKAAHFAARHNVWAYVLRGGRQRYSDDGEPQGTGGLPTLEALLRRGVTNAVIVTTRYFGGILLGAPGLVRAYGQAAGLALEAGEIRTAALCRALLVRCGYGFYSRLQSLISESGGAILETDFGEAVTLTLRFRLHEADTFAARLLEASGGRCRTEILGEEYAEM
ncbi:MAG: YigZ family protein [Oscillospiraceae bacterium]|nr:YigZ family protein [Oscillospiraceae bacterium]